MDPRKPHCFRKAPATYIRELDLIIDFMNWWEWHTKNMRNAYYSNKLHVSKTMAIAINAYGISPFDILQLDALCENSRNAIKLRLTHSRNYGIHDIDTWCNRAFPERKFFCCSLETNYDWKPPTPVEKRPLTFRKPKFEKTLLMRIKCPPDWNFNRILEHWQEIYAICFQIGFKANGTQKRVQRSARGSNIACLRTFLAQVQFKKLKSACVKKITNNSTRISSFIVQYFEQ